MVGVVPSIEMVVWVAVGGRNSLGGAIAGTVLVNFAKDKVSSALPELWPYVLGAMFVLVVLWLPQGLVSLVSRWAPPSWGPSRSRPAESQ
jgi:urea transport system permease protein